MIYNIDIDGVLRDFNNSLYRVYMKHFPDHEVSPVAKEWNLTHRYPLGKDIDKFIYEDYTEDIFLNADAVESGINFVNSLPKTHDIVQIVTANAGNSFLPTVKWLTKHNVYFDSIHFTKHKEWIRGDVLVDDKISNLVNARRAGMIAIAVTHPWNKAWDGPRVADCSEIRNVVSVVMKDIR